MKEKPIIEKTPKYYVRTKPLIPIIYFLHIGKEKRPIISKRYNKTVVNHPYLNEVGASKL